MQPGLSSFVCASPYHHTSVGKDARRGLGQPSTQQQALHSCFATARMLRVLAECHILYRLPLSIPLSWKGAAPFCDETAVQPVIELSVECWLRLGRRQPLGWRPSCCVRMVRRFLWALSRSSPRSSLSTSGNSAHSGVEMGRGMRIWAQVEIGVEIIWMAYLQV